MTSISSGSGPVTGPLGETTGTSTPATVVDRPAESAPVAARDGAGDAAALARTEAARAEAPGSGMTEGPRLELQQWASRLSDLSRELEALPPGSAEANARLAEIRQHLTRLAALQSRVEEGLRSGPAALAQDYLLLLSSSRSALGFLNAHRSDPGSEAFATESTLIGGLQSRLDRSLASLRTLATERLLPSLSVAEGAEPSAQQIGDYRLLLRINGVLGEAELETVRVPRDLTTAYAAHTHPDTVAAGGELPEYLRSSFFRELDPNPPRTGEAPAAHSPDAAFPEGHPMRDLYRTLWEHRGESFSESDANRLIQQLQSLRGELAEGGRYANFVSGSNRGNLTASLENLERLLRNDPRRVPEDNVLNMERPLRLLGTLEYQAQLQSSAGTTTRGRIGLYWRLYEEYRRLGDGEAARGCLYNIYQTSQMNLLPENRTNGLSEADRQAILVRFLEAYVGTGRLDVNFASMMNSLGREIRHLWEHGTEESRFTALSLWTRYNGLHRWIDANYTEGTMNFLLLEPPHRLLGTTAEALPALLQDMENRARASEDPNAGAARLIMVAQAYAAGGDMETCTAILRGIEGSIAAHPANEGNPFASRALILGAFSGAGMSELLGDYVDGWIAADRAALREARPRDRAHALSETLQDWASLMSGLSEIGRPEMASRVFAALDAEMAPLTPESRARVYREILPHMHGAQREEILNRVRDLIGSDAERSEPLSVDARVQLNAILGEFSADPFEIQGAFSALTSIVRHERPSPEMLVEIHRYRLALRNHIHDLVRAHPDRLVEGSDIREMWLWVDGYGGRDGGSNAIVDELTEARRALLNRLSSAAGPGERRRILTLLNDSFREGMRMRLHGNDYGLQAFVDQHLEMIRSLRPAERPSAFAESLQFLNQMEVDRMRARGREVTSFRNVYYDTMTAALPSLIADIPVGPERRSAILQFTRALSQAREAEERRLRSAERALVAVRATSAYHWAMEHGFDSRFLCRTEAENVDALRPAVEAMRRMETSLWNQFAEGESIPEARRVYEGFARAMSLTVEGRSGEARAAMTAYYSDPEVQAFLRSDPAGDAHRAEAQAQIQQLLDVSATILNGEAGARFDRTLRIVRGLARIRLHTLRAEGEEYPYDIGTIDRMTMELPRFLATLPPDRMPQTLEAALQLFGAANEGNARLVSEYNGAINRIPVQRMGEDGAGRTGSVWGLIRAMEHIGDPGGAERAFAALQQVVADDTDWDLLSMEGRGDLGPALQDFCDIILDEGTNVSPDLRQRVADYRARIPEEEEWGHFLRQTFNWQLAVDIGLMALSGGIGGMARAAVSRIVIGLAERAAMRMVSTTAIRMTMMAGRGIAYVGGHVASGVTFNLVHASTSALILNRPMDNPFASGLRMSADSMINDPISMMLFSSIPGPSSMVGRFLYRQVATAITFQISQNIRYHAERGARDLLDSDFHRAVERREHMRAMWEATGDHYYMERFEAAERSVTEIIGHEPDNSVRGIMLNIGMNIGQAGADHVMGTHHWAGHFGMEEAPRAAAERPGAPRSEAERTARREHHVSLADALASTRATRHGSGREAAGGPYRGGAEEGPAREAAVRRVGEERAFFRELVDLDVYENYAPEALDGIVDHVARRFDPHGEPPALNESARRFLRFFFTHVNPEHAGRVSPEALATLLEAAVSGTHPVERTRAAERREPGAEAAPVAVPAERIPGLPREIGDAPLAERTLRASPDLGETIRDREANPEAELGFRLLADEGLADTLAHLDDLLRGADPEALRTAEGRERFLRGYREAREHLEANPDALGGLRPHEALAALMAREAGQDLPSAARRLVAGEIRLRPRSAAEHGLVPPGTHAASPVRRVVAEELTARHQEASLREAARAIDHARREVRELTALLRAREGDPRFAPLESQTRDVRVRLEAAHRRVAEVRERIRELRRAERELSRRGLDPERRRELGVEANRLRRDIAQRIAGIRNAEAGVTRFVAAVRALERATPRPANEAEAAARETVRVDVSEEGAGTGRVADPEAPRRVERAADEGPEIEIVDEGFRVDLSDAGETAPGTRAEELPPHLADPAASARGAAARMNSGLMAVLGLGTLGLTTLAPGTAHAQDAAASGGHGLVADSAQFLSSFLHLSPLAMTGTAATIALGFGAVYAIFRRATRTRAAERAPAGVRESAAVRGRAGETSRGDADGGGRERQQGDAPREDGAGPELPARMAQSPDAALAAPETPRAPAVETSFEGVLQDNAPGAPRRGAIAVREAGPDYGTASGATHEGVGYKDSNEDALVHGVDATGARYAVVLDGMGGMGRGDQASRLAGEVIQAEMSAHGDLMRAFRSAHEAVRRRYPGAGACAVAHRVFRGADGRMRMEIVHVGDSGAVVFGRDGRVIHRTRDQSQVQMLADAGRIEGGELAMRTHPDVNVVLGGLGPSRVQPPVRHEIVLEGGERAVMFSDGLGDNVATEEIVRRVSESGSAEEAQTGLMGLALQRMGILDSLYPQFDDLPDGARIPFTAPDGRTLYLARDLPVSQLQGGEVEMMNVYDAAEGGNLVDHFKPDNVAVHVYFHDPATPVEAPAAEIYVPTQVPIEGAPQPVELPPPPRLGLAADAAEARTIDLLNRAHSPELRPPARPGEPFELHFPDLAALIPVGTERIAGAGAIADPRVAPRHAVVERIGPDALLVQNLDEHQTFVVMPDSSHYPVGKYGFVIRSGQEIVMGGTRVRVTAEGRAPDPDALSPFGFHPFRGHQSFSPNFANGPQEGFGARIHPESGIVPGVGRSYAVESLAAEAPISVRENPADPNSPWRPLAPGERHRLRFAHGVSEEFRNTEGLVSRMTRHGEIVHVRGGEIALEVEAPGAPPIELALGERERFAIGTRPESDVALPPYGEADGRVLLDPYLHIPSSPDPRLRFAPDVPADHAEVYRTAAGEWRIRNLSGAVMEITGSGENHFFLPRGGEMTLSDGQQIVFRGERPYRYRFRIPRSEAPTASEPALPRAEVGRRTSAWLEAPDAAALNRRLAAEGVPLRVRAQEGPQDAEAAVRALAETPPTLLLRFENGRLTPDSVELLYAFAAMPEP
ncbi:MAG: protein phosphatase 2C domain-containing protein, partial [Deltaproteobacteria bacterium]|nr:protein phosphatase 2C domain-containing protein [Deltaproteobacteria bacterium]